MKWKLVPALALCSLQACAGQGTDDLQLSGFATLGGVWTEAGDVRFARIGIDRPGPENPDSGPDSVFGIQASQRLSERNNLVVQLVSRESPRDAYQPRATLAFLSHALTPELTLRAGRLRIPFFMLSDSIDINHAQPWVRPPVEVYSLNPFADLDGIDALYRVRHRDIDIELHPYVGRSRIPIYAEGKGGMKDLTGINLALAHGDLALHFGHARMRLELHWGDPVNTLVTNGLRSVGRDDILNEMSGADSSATFSSVGFQWDDGRWLLIGEYARRQSRRYVNSADGWHLTAGRRFGSLTPYLTLARQFEREPVVDADLVASTGIPALAAGLDAFNQSRNLAQRSISAGLRWDFMDNAAFKAEYSHMRTDEDAWGSFFPRGNQAAATMGGQSINLLSLSVDVTF